MCGIFGVAYGKSRRELGNKEKFISNALEVGVIRGHDSTGMFGVVSPKTPADYVKLALPAPLFKSTLVANRFMSKINMFDAVIGHHRAATRGGINHDSAHPYQYGPITMVHNGTLFRYDNISDGKTFLTDSEAIAYSLEKNGAEETLKRIDGAFALIWHDARTGCLYATRNSERPLHFCTVKEDDSIFFASESGMLSWLVQRAQGANYTVKDMYYVTEKRLIEFPMGNPLKWKSKEVEFYVRPKPLKKTTTTGTGGNNVLKLGGKNQSVRALEREMTKNGYRRGSRIAFSPSRFEPRQDNIKRGKIYGVTDDSFALEVLADNQSINLIINKGAYFLTAEITGYFFDEDGWPVIAVKKVQESNDLDPQPIFMSEYGTYKPTEELDKSKGPNNSDGTLPLMIAGPSGEISINEFNKLTKDGCSLCQKDLLPYMASTISWVDFNSPLCPACADQWQNSADYGVTPDVS